MDPHASVAMVVPAYLPRPSADESVSLRRAAEALGTLHTILVTPDGLDPAPYREVMRIDEVASFPKDCFVSSLSYSRLLLSPEFYGRFAAFEWILVYQPDVFVLSDTAMDDLATWCAKPYDYLGGPLVTTHGEIGRRLRREYVHPVHGDDGWGCNGGLALRRIPAFLRVLEAHRAAADAWEEDEDFFWSFAAPCLDRDFRTPARDEALRFAFHGEAEPSWDLAGERLPFGCHAWHLSRAFWAPHFRARGYEVAGA